MYSSKCIHSRVPLANSDDHLLPGWDRRPWRWSSEFARGTLYCVHCGSSMMSQWKTLWKDPHRSLQIWGVILRYLLYGKTPQKLCKNTSGSFQGVFHCDIIDSPQCTLRLGVISSILICNSLKVGIGMIINVCMLSQLAYLTFVDSIFMTTYYTHTTLLHALMRH